MVQEMTELTQQTDIRKESVRGATRNDELNMEKLRTFSRSLENLNSETLYSKWKRARGIDSRSARRARSISLTTAPSFSQDQKDQNSQPARKNSFHVLQENVFRPRCWTIGESFLEVIRENNAMHSLDFNNNIVQQSTKGSTSQLQRRRRKAKQQFTVSLHLPNKQHSSPSPDERKMEPTTRGEIKSVDVEQKDKINCKEMLESASEIVVRPSQRSRRGSEDARKSESSPIVAQFIGEKGESTKKVDLAERKPVSSLFIEAVRVEISPQPMIMPASPETALMNMAESPAEPSGGFNGTVVKNASEMRANNERSKTLQNTFSLGCTYAVVSQPSLRAKDSSVNNKAAVKMSNGITKQQRDQLEDEFKKLKKVSLELDRAEIEEERINNLYTLPDVGSHEGLEVQPLGRFSELKNSINTTRTSDRPTATAILENLANAAHKTEQERIQQIEKAFEWIRKELAELRAQDKDIMRTFTKIQAGIRKIKLQRAFTYDMDEPYEFDIVDHSIDLSASFSYAPFVESFHNTLPRRASLI